MENFNVLGVHEKIWVLGGREVTKNQYIRGSCLKRRAWTICRFKGGAWHERGAGVVFLKGGWYPNAHYVW